jgi:AcrR family transcriptional regulator
MMIVKLICGQGLAVVLHLDSNHSVGNYLTCVKPNRQPFSWSYDLSMAWDTEQTKSRLLDAASDEFAMFGFAGARIDRISTRAGVNRERIYSYFRNKSGLFEAVLLQQVAQGLDEVSLIGDGPDAVVDFAGAYFDASLANPTLARLTAWEGLERVEPVGASQRAQRASLKAVAIELAVPGLTYHAAQDLFLTIVTLCHGWTAGRNVGFIITGVPDDNGRRRAHIRSVVRAALRSATTE